MMHRSDLSRSKKEFRCCRSKECGSWVKMTITELKDTVTKILNYLMANPMLSDSTGSQYIYEPSLEVQRMNNDIERMIGSQGSDRDTVQKRILECAAKKYDEYKNTQHITDRLKSDLKRTGPISSYSPELFKRTVSAVIILRKAQNITMLMASHHFGEAETSPYKLREEISVKREKTPFCGDLEIELN